MYNRPALAFVQPGGRPTTVLSGEVSSTRQHLVGHADEEEDAEHE